MAIQTHDSNMMKISYYFRSIKGLPLAIIMSTMLPSNLILIRLGVYPMAIRIYDHSHFKLLIFSNSINGMITHHYIMVS